MNLSSGKANSKLILFILLFPFFYASLVSAQDTIVLKTGQKKRVQIVSVGNEIVFKLPPSDTLRAYYPNEVGSIYTITRPDNSAPVPLSVPVPGQSEEPVKKIIEPYMLVSGGGSFPVPNGYGGTPTYYFNYFSAQQSAYSGYALNGYTYGVTAGLKLTHGWEVMASYSQFVHGFDASGYLNENADIFINGHYIAGTGYPGDDNAYTNNTYYYKNYCLLIGGAKNWGGQVVTFGVGMMLGEFTTNLPAMQGYYTTEQYVNGGYSPVNYYFNTNSNQVSKFDFELRMHVDVKVAHHIIIRGMADIHFSTTDLGTSYELLDTNGNKIVSGSFTYYNQNNSIYAGIGNLTIGVGYEL